MIAISRSTTFRVCGSSLNKVPNAFVKEVRKLISYCFRCKLVLAYDVSPEVARRLRRHWLRYEHLQKANKQLNWIERKELQCLISCNNFIIVQVVHRLCFAKASTKKAKHHNKRFNSDLGNLRSKALQNNFSSSIVQQFAFHGIAFKREAFLLHKLQESLIYFYVGECFFFPEGPANWCKF